MATEIKVGLAGFGNVGKGTYDILKRNHSLSLQTVRLPGLQSFPQTAPIFSLRFFYDHFAFPL